MLAPASSRFITSHDQYSGSSLVIEMFFKAIQTFRPDLIVLAGVHLLEAQPKEIRLEKLRLIKRSLITVFMSIELMLNAVNLSFVTFAHEWQAVKGQIFVFFVMMIAAAEAAVGLAIIIAIYRARATLNVDQIDLMKL